MHVGVRFLIACWCIAFVSTSAFAHGTPTKSGTLGDAPNAQKTADELLPASLQGPARDPAKAVIDKLKTWKTGDTLSICFFSGDSKIHAKIADVAKIWTNFANLKF